MPEDIRLDEWNQYGCVAEGRGVRFELKVSLLFNIILVCSTIIGNEVVEVLEAEIRYISVRKYQITAYWVVAYVNLLYQV